MLRMTWREREQVLSLSPMSYPASKLTEQQKEICKNVKCVLSTPILSKRGRVMGILNLDSTQRQGKGAGLASKHTQDHVQAYVDILAELY